MTSVVVSFSTKQLVVPLTVVPGKYVVSIGGVGSQTVDASPATFTDVPPGDYVVTVVRKDVNDQPIGDAASGTVSVPVPVQTVDVPDVVTVSLV